MNNETTTGMKKLIGERCVITFSLDHLDWPLQGYPAFAIVTDVDMPLIEFDGRVWINANTIRTIATSK